MFGITDKDVLAVYEQLKDKYPLLMTTAAELGEGFTIDCPVLVGKAHGLIIELYSDGDMFVLDVMDAERTKGTHWHPNDVEGAVDDIIEFMEGQTDHERYPFNSFPYLDNQTTLSREEANEPDRHFRIAKQSDAEQVLSLYQSAKGGEFCVWNDSYPSMTEIARDLETKNLYVMTDGGKIMGAISVVPENELDGFDCWSCKDGKEIARVVIDKAYQGRGLSYEMVQSVAAILGKNGCKAIHLSVVKSNIPAYKTYIKAGFVTVGEADLYGNRYYLMEKTIDTRSPA